MLSKLLIYAAAHGIVGNERIIFPGDRESASLFRKAEHHRVLAEIRRDARASRLSANGDESPSGIATRIRASLSRSS